jgi:hypothetical protein
MPAAAEEHAPDDSLPNEEQSVCMTPPEIQTERQSGTAAAFAIKLGGELRNTSERVCGVQVGRPFLLLREHFEPF